MTEILMRLQLTEHARYVLSERALEMDWIERTVESPERVEDRDDGTRHYLARVPEREGRVLRVVLNPDTDPPCVVTVFLDRRMKGQLP